jgi:hypothetical protein
MARSWYAYNGIGDPLLPASYNLTLGKPFCINGINVCVIYAPGGFSPSPLSFNMKNYISNGQLQLLPQPSFPAGVKKYVYMKN